MALDHNAALKHLSDADRILARLIDRVGSCTLKPRLEHSIFYSLMRSIIYQQLAGRAAATILGRVHGVFPGKKYPDPEDIVAASDDVLRSAGLSRNKLAAIRDLASKTMNGTVPTTAQARRMSNEELIERLVTIRGIGVWTVEMLLIFRLGRPDVFPVTDYGVRKGFARTFRTRELPTAQQMLMRAERWRPYRSVASWYMWRAAEME